MSNPIHHTFAPHVNCRYVLRTLSLLFRPWKWKNGSARENLRTELQKRFSADAFLFASGREAMLALLRALGGPVGEEVIVQAYTCVVLPNAIQAAGKVPVYAEIGRETLNIDCDELEKAITPRTRAVICQHTFGIPADTERLREICTRRNLLLIEDCAHIIPDETGPAAIGKHGDFVLLSFGRDKAVSGITGGAILSRKTETSARLGEEEAHAVSFGLIRIKRLLLYPLVYTCARPFYGLGIGKAFLVFSRRIGALVPILDGEEKKGTMKPILHTLPNACASLALSSLNNLRQINDHRRALTSLYQEEGKKLSWPMLSGALADLPLQKFPLFVKGADEIRRKLKKRNIHLDDGWTGCVVCPRGIDFDPVNYVPGSDPEAEAVCEKILSLPTHPTMTEKQARKMIAALSLFLEKNSIAAS
ncbi:MAG: aminotransferase class I/II-fold pyridoxal phosphate-dependent enzyme [Candidatus Peribacteraceae bacterium]|nr:aminotransferase class I/II-fold pyridoxal phosphate-dependent enzyme [Candidatus Peribacteraceae bacterium]MDD5074891.1 aminotransferase class I/II-fold pyridoxal phosphate-dependent enzyme [Candidatus Peribacteraceae bacterium]